MKKLLSLVLCFIMIFSAMSVVSSASADEPTYTPVDKETVATYWPMYDSVFYDSDKIVKQGDWYYMEGDWWHGPNKTFVCGYSGSETDIVLPTEFNDKPVSGAVNFYIFSLGVKTITIPKEYTNVGADFQIYDLDDFYNERPDFHGNVDSLTEIIVEEGSRNFKSIDGVLYSISESAIKYYPPNKEGSEYIVPETVTTISAGAFKEARNLKSITITRNVNNLGRGAIPTTLEELYIENAILPTFNGYYSDYDSDSTAEPDFVDSLIPVYYPQVPNATVYCVEDSPLYKYYEEYGFSSQVCKELKALTKFPDELVKEADGKWYYYHSGVNAHNHRSYHFEDKPVELDRMLKYNGKWFYVKDGIWDKTAETLFKYNGVWFYIKGGKWDTAAKSTTDLIKYNGKWFYVKNGKWSTANNTLIKKNGKWFAVKDGKWYKGKSLISYKGYKFYVNNGFAQLGYNGKVKINGKTYTIKGGKVA